MSPHIYVCVDRIYTVYSPLLIVVYPYIFLHFPTYPCVPMHSPNIAPQKKVGPGAAPGCGGPHPADSGCAAVLGLGFRAWGAYEDEGLEV